MIIIDMEFYVIDKNKYINLQFKHKTLEDALNQLLVCIDNSLDILISNKVKMEYKNINFDYLECIECYGNQLITNIYKFNLENFAFTDIHNNFYHISSFKFLFFIEKLIYQKISKIDNSFKSVKNDIVNYPKQMNAIIIDKNKNKTTDIISPIDLKHKIDELYEFKKIEQEKLDNLTKINQKHQENFTNFCNKIGNKKRKLKKNIEKENEKRNKFEANKEAYKKIKQDIADNKLVENDISILFKNEYPLYKFMDNNNLLDKPDEFNIYSNIYDKLYHPAKYDKEYIPHNINYLSNKKQDSSSNYINNELDLKCINDNEFDIDLNNINFEEIIL